MSRTYLCVSVDTEQDHGPTALLGERRAPTFEGVTVGVLERLQPLFASFGGKPTYLLSEDVIGDAHVAERLHATAASAELGTLLRGAGGDRQREALTRLTDRFIRAFGFQPRAFRTGTSTLRSATIGHLESLGYSVESSVTPNVALADDGAFLDAPTQPYRPDREAPAREGDADIVEVPITIRRRRWSALPGIGKRLAPRWLRPTWMSEDALVRLAEDEIGEARRVAPRRPVVLHAVLDATEVVPSASRLAEDEAGAHRTLDRLRALLAFADRQGIPMIGLGDVPEILQT